MKAKGERRKAMDKSLRIARTGCTIYLASSFGGFHCRT
jgi:hypothetical protein